MKDAKIFYLVVVAAIAIGLAATLAIGYIGVYFIESITAAPLEIDEDVKVTKIDDDVKIIHVAEDLIVVMGPEEKVRVTRIPAALKIIAPMKAPRVKWTIPYSCADVRYYKRTYTAAQIESMRKSLGIRLPTAVERTQITQCLAGNIK